ESGSDRVSETVAEDLWHGTTRDAFSSGRRWKRSSLTLESKIEIPTDRSSNPEEYYPPRPRPDADAIRHRTAQTRLREDAERGRRDGRHERGAGRDRRGGGVGRGDGPRAG